MDDIGYNFVRMANWHEIEDKIRQGERLSFQEGADLYHSNDTQLSITVGPPVAFVKPPRALIVAPRSDTMVAKP